MYSRLVLSVGLLLCISTLLQAQVIQPQPGQRRQPGMQPQPNQRQPGMQQNTQPVEIKGTVELAMRGMIGVVDDKNQQWRVAVSNDTVVSVTGTATADFLRSGLTVEFQAEINDRGEIKDKVGELKIVTPSKDRTPGFHPSGAAGGEQDGFGAAPGGKSGKKRALAAGSYRIVGQLTVARGGKLSVKAGHGLTKFELAEEPKIDIDMTDYTVAAKGDKVSIEGVMMTNQPGMARANKVEIQLSEPLTGGKKKPAAKPAPKRPPRSPKQDQPPTEPPPENIK